MIHDGPENFPDSVVEYVDVSEVPPERLRVVVKQIFAFMRQKEKIKQMEVKHYGRTLAGLFATLELRVIESMLIYMATNTSGDDEEYYRSRRGF